MSDRTTQTVLSSPTAVIVVGLPALFGDWLSAQRAGSSEIHWLAQLISPLEEEKSIKIDAIRQLKAELALSLHAKEGRDVVLLPADTLTDVAQQALLKILEEPPQRVKFWLVTQHPTTLLDTIASRSIVFELPKPESPGLADDLAGETVDLAVFEAVSPGQALGLVQGFSNVAAGREKAAMFVQSLLLQLRAAEPTAAHKQLACLEALDWLHANAHVGLTMDNLMVTLWKSAQKPPR